MTKSCKWQVLAKLLLTLSGNTVDTIRKRIAYIGIYFIFCIVASLQGAYDINGYVNQSWYVLYV